MDLHPTDGVRILLELDRPGEEGADYRGAILTPTERRDYRVAITRGAVTLEGAAGAPLPEAALDPAEGLLRSIARTVGKHALATAPPTWPRRVLRWRKPR